MSVSSTECENLGVKLSLEAIYDGCRSFSSDLMLLCSMDIASEVVKCIKCIAMNGISTTTAVLFLNFHPGLFYM